MNIPRRVKSPAYAKDEFDQVLQIRDSWWRLGNTYYLSFGTMVYSVLNCGGWLDAWWALAERFGRWQVSMPDGPEVIYFLTHAKALKFSSAYPGAPLPVRAER